jgi:hypothetical protein
MIWIEASSSIPYLVWNLDHSSSCIRPTNEPGVSNRRCFLFFYRDKCAIFQCFAFLNRWVSLKEREFIYSKFQLNINSTTHHILRLGGSSIPWVELNSMLCSWVSDQSGLPECKIWTDFRPKTAIWKSFFPIRWVILLNSYLQKSSYINFQ